MATNKRNLSIEFLRMYCMFFILTGHLAGYFSPIFETYQPEIDIFRYFLNCFGIFSVDCFVLISGYFLVGTSFKSERVFKIYTQTLFWTFSICLLMFLLHNPRASLYELIKSLFPLAPTHYNYWFVTKYLGMVLLHPFLSRLACSITLRQYSVFMAILVFVNTELVLGFPMGGQYSGPWTLMWFICLYFTGGYLKRFGSEIMSKFRRSALFIGGGLSY